MTVRERILLLRLLEKLEKQPEYIEKLGIYVDFGKNQRIGGNICLRSLP